MPNVRAHQLTPVLTKNITDRTAAAVALSRTSEIATESLTAEQLGFLGPVTHAKAYGTDAASVLAAIDATPAGGTLFFEDGTYDLSTGWPDPKEITKSIRITGGQNVHLQGPLDNTAMFRLNTGVDLWVQDVKISGFYTLTRFQTSVNIGSLIVRDCIFDGVRFTVYNSGSNYPWVERLHFTGNQIISVTRQTERGVYCDLSDWSSVVIKDNTFVGLYGEKAVAVKIGEDSVDASDGVCVISGNLFKNIQGSVAATDCHGVQCHAASPVIVNNTFQNITNAPLQGDNCEGIYVKAARPVITGNILIDAGQEAFIQHKGTGPQSGGTRCGVVSGNHMYRSAGHTMEHIGGVGGFGIAATGQTIVSDNNIEGLYKGIYMSGADEGSITGNVIRSLDGNGNSVFAIYVSNGENCTIANNSITDIDNGSSSIMGIRLRSTTGGAAEHGFHNVSGNIIRNFTSTSNTVSAFYIESSSSIPMRNITFAGNTIDGVKRVFQPVGSADQSGHRFLYNSTSNVTDYVHHSGPSWTDTLKFDYDNNMDATVGLNDPNGSVVPKYIGHEYLDVVTNYWWKSQGTANTDWKLITNEPGQAGLYQSGPNSPVNNTTPLYGIGSLFLETTNNLWYKATTTDTLGWVMQSNMDRVAEVMYAELGEGDTVSSTGAQVLFYNNGTKLHSQVFGTDTVVQMPSASGVFQKQNIKAWHKVTVTLACYSSRVLADSDPWSKVGLYIEQSQDGATGWTKDLNKTTHFFVVPPQDLSGSVGVPIDLVSFSQEFMLYPGNTGNELEYFRVVLDNVTSAITYVRWGTAVRIEQVEDYA